MNFTIYNPKYAQNILNTINNKIQPNKVYKISFEEVKQLKTKKQLGFIFGGIIKALCLYFERLGYNFSPSQIKEWIYSEIGISDSLFLPNGKKVTIVKTLSGMTKNEASEFICKLIMFIDSSEALVDFILPPDLRYCWVNHISEKTINNIKEFNFSYKSELYLKHQRNLTCIRCGAKGGQAHHIKLGSGLGRKNPDWFSIPICPKCHYYLHSSVGEPNFLNEIKFITGNLDIKTFCKIAYYLWLCNYK
jgi:hypothetical protein